MAYEHKPGQGSAFKNNDKKEDWHADYKGDVMLPDGALHWLEVTPKTTQAGEVFYKVKIGNVKVPKSGMSSHNTAKGNAYQPQDSSASLLVMNPDEDIPF
jgi:hypothetical protein